MILIESYRVTLTTSTIILTIDYCQDLHILMLINEKFFFYNSLMTFFADCCHHIIKIIIKTSLAVAVTGVIAAFKTP